MFKFRYRYREAKNCIVITLQTFFLSYCSIIKTPLQDWGTNKSKSKQMQRLRYLLKIILLCVKMTTRVDAFEMVLYFNLSCVESPLPRVLCCFVCLDWGEMTGEPHMDSHVVFPRFFALRPWPLQPYSTCWVFCRRTLFLFFSLIGFFVSC